MSDTQILYIEDNQSHVFLCQEYLELMGDPFTIDAASSFEEAKQKYDPKRHSLIMTDYNLPDAEAPEIVKSFREEHPGVVIVVLSAAYTEDRIEKVKAEGVTACWEKDNFKSPLEKVAELLSS